MLDLNPKAFDIVLGSQSPRRKMLLEQLGYSFKQKALNIDESYPSTMEVTKIAEFLSLKKAKAYEAFLDEKTLLITSDTTVCIDNQVLGKAKNMLEAKQMLNELSGKTHSVITGVTLKNKEKTVSFSVETEVKMKDLSTNEIDYYIANFQPFDKAGAYGIQEWIGFIGVDYIKGSFYNVMGLPLKELYEEIIRF